MNYIIFDTETTGIEPGSRPVEIHCSLVGADGVVVDEFDSLVHPGMPIPADVSAIHGITDADVAQAPSLRECMEKWTTWIDRHASESNAAVGIAHNAPYDVGVLGWSLGLSGQRQPSLKVIDTLAMAKAIKATKRNSLDALVEHYGITRRGDAHRARCDVAACLDYWHIARELLPDFQPVPWALTYQYTAALPDHMAELPAYVATGKPFAFSYTDAKGNRTDRQIIPYGWAQGADGISFHGLCLLRNERRTFLADRASRKGAAA